LLLIGNILRLSLISGIFYNLQSTSTKKEKQIIAGIRRKSGGPKFELSDEQKTDIKSAFALFDKESTGFIATRELKVKFKPFSVLLKRLIPFLICFSGSSASSRF
jgi:hypothetical protein